MLAKTQIPVEQMTTNIKERIRILIDAVGSQAELGRIAGVTPQAVTGWIARGSIGRRSAEKIAEHTGFELEWILTGKGPKVEEEANLDGYEWQLISPTTRRLIKKLIRLERQGLINPQLLRAVEIGMDEYIDALLSPKLQVADHNPPYHPPLKDNSEN